MFADERLEARHNPRNLGMVDNWNYAIDASETELVSLLHADDRLLPRYVELMLELGGRHPRAAALFCGARIIDAYTGDAVGEDGKATFTLDPHRLRVLKVTRAPG